MQVVYSGGSTPSPSPRLQRKAGYCRPTMPGYMAHVHPQVLVQRSREKLTEGDMSLRDSIPAMSKTTAIMCLVMNIILPGSGTLAAGLSVLCCSHVRPKGDSKGHCIWVNAGVALLQFSLTFLFLLGWIWSIMWGVAFLNVSKKYFNQDESNQLSDSEKTTKIIQQKLKNVSDANAGSDHVKKPRKKHQCFHVSRHQEQHHHEHCRRHTFNESSTDSQSYSVSDNSISRTCSPDLYIIKHISSSNGFSHIPDMYGVKPTQLPRPASTTLQIPQVMDSYGVFLESPDSGMGRKVKSGRVRLQREPETTDNDSSWLQLHHQHFQALTSQSSPALFK